MVFRALKLDELDAAKAANMLSTLTSIHSAIAGDLQLCDPISSIFVFQRVRK